MRAVVVREALVAVAVAVDDVREHKDACLLGPFAHGGGNGADLDTRDLVTILKVI